MTGIDPMNDAPSLPADENLIANLSENASRIVIYKAKGNTKLHRLWWYWPSQRETSLLVGVLAADRYAIWQYASR